MNRKLMKSELHIQFFKATLQTVPRKIRDKQNKKKVHKKPHENPPEEKETPYYKVETRTTELLNASHEWEPKRHWVNK